MEKIEIDFKIDYCLDWTWGISIEQLKKDIKEIEKLGATHVHIEHDVSYECSYVTIEATCRRMETDEEFEERKKHLEESKERRKQSELAQLYELKRKYGI